MRCVISARAAVIPDEPTLQQHVLSPTHRAVITFNDFVVNEFTFQPPGTVSDYLQLVCSPSHFKVIYSTSSQLEKMLASPGISSLDTLREHIAESSLSGV